MLSITKESAKQHCRTCLKKLSDVGTTKFHRSMVEDDTKSICVNVSTNENLLHLIEYYIEKNILNNVEYPQNVCLICFNKLQGFDLFRKQALESIATLKSLFVEGGFGVAKVELEDELENEKASGNKKMVGKIICEALQLTNNAFLRKILANFINIFIPYKCS